MANRERTAEQLFGAALDLQPEHRSAFLDQACRNTPELRRLVDQLLREYERAGSFLAYPLLTPAAQSHPSNPPVATSANQITSLLPPSARFQPAQLIANRFLVVRFIARGGMGEVYEVKDQLLHGTSVALKIVRSEIAADAASSHRFEQEVILARRVTHPSLCPIYEIFHCELPAPPFLFLTMKLLGGETLAAGLKAPGNLTSVEKVETCRKLLSGVAALHAAGIIHRDLKPNNVMLERSGESLNISIMDFGLARLHEAESTVLAPGMVAGTPGYMAPELLRGQQPTKATDLFALGVVLHQVLTGERPLQAKGGLAVTPSPSLRSARAPAYLIQSVENFLSEDPERRDRAFERVQLGNGSPSLEIPSARAPTLLHRRWIWFGIVAAFAFLMTAAAIWMTPATVSGPLDSLQVTFSAEPKEGPLFTDGSRLYFESRGAPSEMAISGGMIAPMPLVAPGMALQDISADGSKVLESKSVPGDEIGRGILWVAWSLGGSPRNLSNHLALVARWSPDGNWIAFSDRRTLYRIDADGGNLSEIWGAPGDVADLAFSPDGRQLTVTVEQQQVSRLWNVEADGKNAHPLQIDWPENTNQFSGRWTPDGKHFLFASDREGRGNVYELISPRWFAFWKQPMAVRITGNQVPILAFAPARDGKSLFVLARMEQGAQRAFDPRTGKLEPYLEGLSALQFVISPDRQWMAYTEYPTGHLWKSRLDGSDRLQLTNSYGVMQQWSPDGRWLAYHNWHKLYLVSADGGAPQQLIPGHGLDEVAPTWFPDGKSVGFNYYPLPDQPLTGIHVVDLASRKLSVMPKSAGYYVPSWSPDGRFLVAMAQNPSRMVLYSGETKLWKDLRRFDVPWGYWVWASDSKSLYMGLIDGENGIYRLTVPQGRWDKLSGLEGVNDPKSLDSFVSLTAEGQPAMMSRTGVAQIYSLRWKQ